MSSTSNRSFRMPGEWEPHRATWVAWPHNPEDFPAKLSAVQWVYTEIIGALSQSELVEILCHDEAVLEMAEYQLRVTGIQDNIRFHLLPTDRGWLRDSFPTAVKSTSDTSDANAWINWKFNAWAKYSNFSLDARVPAFVANYTDRPLVAAVRHDGTPLVLEGGAIDVNGAGSLLTTEECLLSPIQERNPGLSREQYESLFSHYLGISNTIWLAGSCAGDDTHGHVDDAARFVNEHTVLVAVEHNSADANYSVSQKNLDILNSSTDQSGKRLNVIELPMPHPREFDGDRLPASYANFYIANKVVIVPTFNDPNDRRALSIISEQFPDREVIGIHSVDLVLGYGALHCLTQQEPAD